MALIESEKFLSLSEMATAAYKTGTDSEPLKNLIGFVSDDQVPDWYLDALPYYDHFYI